MEPSFDMSALAREHLRGFARTILHLWGNSSFDCVLAPANSGAVMYGIAKEICRTHGIAVPPLVLVPAFTAYRFGNGSGDLPYDNGLAHHALAPQLGELPARVKNICYLDDEIGHGTAFRASWEALRAAAAPRIGVDCAVTIIAEANGFFSDYPLTGARTIFAPYATRPSPDISGIIYYVFPEQVFDDFCSWFGVEDKKEILAAIFGMPTKALDRKQPILSGKLLRRAQRDPQYPVWREQCSRAILDIAGSPATIKKL